MFFDHTPSSGLGAINSRCPTNSKKVRRSSSIQFTPKNKRTTLAQVPTPLPNQLSLGLSHACEKKLAFIVLVVVVFAKRSPLKLGHVAGGKIATLLSHPIEMQFVLIKVLIPPKGFFTAQPWNLSKSQHVADEPSETCPRRREGRQTVSKTRTKTEET